MSTAESVQAFVAAKLRNFIKNINIEYINSKVIHDGDCQVWHMINYKNFITTKVITMSCLTRSSVNIQSRTIYPGGAFISYSGMGSASSYMGRFIAGISRHGFTIFVRPKAMEFDQNTDHRITLPAVAIKKFSQLQYVAHLHAVIYFTFERSYQDNKSCSVILHGSAGFTMSKISSFTS